jgi:hypothetical protein
MLKVFEQITGLKKAATKRDAERKELADVIEQERLIEMKSEWRSKRCGMPVAILLIISPYTVQSQGSIPSSASRRKEDRRSS